MRRILIGYIYAPLALLALFSVAHAVFAARDLKFRISHGRWPNEDEKRGLRFPRWL